MAQAWLPILRKRLAGERDIILCRTVKEMVDLRAAADILAIEQHRRLASVGFVPTMGALHHGHLSLTEMAKAGKLDDTQTVAPPADVVVSSIFVNPTQFAPTEDLGKYPRTWEDDLAKLRARGVHAVFAPTAADMYPPYAQYRTFVTLTDIDGASPEGGARPGFFRGVATVVSKLLNIVRPTDAYFGQKDGIQCITVRAAVRDLNLPTRIHIGDTVREQDGLAMSSRNVYLSPEEREAAPVIYRALSTAVRELGPSVAAVQQAKRAAGKGAELSAAEAERMAQQAAVAHNGSQAESSPYAPSQPLSRELAQAAEAVRSSIASTHPFGPVQYVTFSCGLTGRPISSLEQSGARNGAVLLSVAAKIGSTRLLDNVVVGGTPNDLGWPQGMPDYEVTSSTAAAGQR